MTAHAWYEWVIAALVFTNILTVSVACGFYSWARRTEGYFNVVREQRDDAYDKLKRRYPVKRPEPVQRRS